MNHRVYPLYGFEGSGGRNLVLETSSATEASDLRQARVASGFKTAVFSQDRELTLEELEQRAALEDRFG